ncbi:MAG: hypothetical protein F6K32_11110 [Desertifilum sp. SIO1I2]|nr:hypothetical protein [Desertifilum sp. SIO1I2]
MEQVQRQINTLTLKVDAISQTLDQLNGKVAQILTDMSINTTQKTSRMSLEDREVHLPYSSTHRLQAVLEHKDVLSDDNYGEKEAKGAERTLSPEIQIQRLTAQLTAAYNRIAALEEQLLSQRIH